MGSNNLSPKRKNSEIRHWFLSGVGIKRWLVLLGLAGLLCGMALAFAFAGSRQAIGLPLLLSVICLVFFAIAFVRVLLTLERITTLARRGRLDIYLSGLRRDASPMIVTIGGGTGMSTLLRGFREYGTIGQDKTLTAIVTVTDDGGSSGRLREDFNIPPPGDIRNCLAAMSHAEPLIERLFQYRFPEGTSIAGHNFGNLFIAAMTAVTGSFDKAVRESTQVLAVRGKVLPSTLEMVQLEATLDDGQIITGESRISGLPRGQKRIRSVRLLPEDAQPPKEAIQAIRKADAIILGPGSLFTSIIPNLLIPQLREALLETRASLIYVVNVMTQHNETDHFSVGDHVEAIKNALGRYPDLIVANDSTMPADLLERYRAENAHPVKIDTERIQQMGLDLHQGDFLSRENCLRHNPGKLADFLIQWINERMER